jgi:lysophospholipase L1-like esterase
MLKSSVLKSKLLSIILTGLLIVGLVISAPKAVFAAATNIAIGKTATADSAQSGYPASNGNDKSTTTRWCAADANNKHYWTVDLGALYNLTGTEILFEKSVVYKYRVETSTDNTNWTLRVDKSNNTSTTQTQTDAFLGIARYVKVIILEIPSKNWASFYDFRVFGTAFTSSTPPMVYIAGDSTVQTYSTSFAPQAGWGQYIQDYFTKDVMFDNRAIGGRSSKSFIVEGRLDAILSVIRANDYLLIQFGHNDASTIADRHTDPYTTYKDYLKQYVTKARAKGAIPVLITPVARLNYSSGVFKNDFPDYVTAMKQVATETNTPCVDMMNKCLSYYATAGYNTVYPYYLVSSNGTDYTHFTNAGAQKIASMLSQELKALNIKLSSFVK